MIAGTPWPPSSIPAPKVSPTAASLVSKLTRRLPAAILTFVCAATIACVVILVLFPTFGIAAPLGAAHALVGVSPAVVWGVAVLFAATWILAVASAVTVARVPPGHIPLWLYSREPGDQAYFHNVLQAVEKKLDGSLRFCRKCGAFKPDLAHHSKELGLCILCYQHWDVWSNNAIGFYNHKMYLLALGYGAFAHMLTVGLLLPGVLRAATSGGCGLDELPARVLLALWVGGDASVLAFAFLALVASALLGGGSLYALRKSTTYPTCRRTRVLTQHVPLSNVPNVPLPLARSPQAVAALPRRTHRAGHHGTQLLPAGRVCGAQAAKGAHPGPAF